MPRAKFLLKLFLKSLRFPKAAPWSLSAESEISLRRFSFWLEQERARWAIKRVRSTEKTRRIECDLAFKATMFLTGQVFFLCALCVKRKSVMGGEFVKNGPSRTPVPTGFGENFDILLVGEHSICSRKGTGGYGIRTYGFDCCLNIRLYGRILSSRV